MTPPPTAFSESGSTPPAPGFRGAASGEAGTLVALLARQRDHYQQLKTLSDQQQDMIERGEAEQLLAVLGKRQGHVEALTTLNEKLAPLRPRMSQIAEEAPPEVRDELRGLVDGVQSLLEQIIEQDEQDKTKLTEGRAAVREQLGQTARAPVALAAYKVVPPQAVARFTDHRG